jgi:hypothetical protein
VVLFQSLQGTFAIQGLVDDANAFGFLQQRHDAINQHLVIVYYKEFNGV